MSASPPAWPPRRVAVFRALQLGDMLCATPVLRALRKAWPSTHISVIGLPWAQALCERLSSVDDFISFPGHDLLPERSPDPNGWPAFRARVLDADLDLLIQLHGDGRVVNQLLQTLAVPRMAGFVPPGGQAQALQRVWPGHGSEVQRLLAILPLLGVPSDGAALELPLRAEDRQRAADLVGGSRAYACVHVGARWSSRRWPVERFAALADFLAGNGLEVVLTGTLDERALVRSTLGAMRQPALDLCGRTDLWSLGALLAGARVLVCNDTGVSHVAAALRCPSLVLSSGSEVARWAPQDRQLHRVQWQAADCRPCFHADCPHGSAVCADALSVDAARTELVSLLDSTRSRLAKVGLAGLFAAHSTRTTDDAEPMRGPA